MPRIKQKALTAELAKLIGDCERALWQGLAAARAGARLSDISCARVSARRRMADRRTDAGDRLVQ